MPATISSTFDIVIEEAIAAGSSLTISNPGRSYRIISMSVTGVNGALATLTRVGTGGTVAVLAIPVSVLNDVPARVEIANTLVTDEALLLTVSGANSISRVVIVCEAAAAQTLTLTRF